MVLAAPAVAAGPCASPANVVVAENCLPGNPASEWDVSGAGDSSIQGFATASSVQPGSSISFKVDTAASSYRIDVYRLGWYGGSGARKVATLTPSATLPQLQPACTTDITTDLVDCGNWAVSATWLVPVGAVSGMYVAKLVRMDPEDGRASHVVFVVRADTRGADLLLQSSDTTTQAYNRYGGQSLYSGGVHTGAGRAYKVSYNRPVTTRGTSAEDYPFNSELPMLRWLEANGYDVSYTTGSDVDRDGAQLLTHRVFMSVGHDEYWSAAQRANVTAARDAGVHLAFFSGNEIFWKTRWENDSSGGDRRVLVSYKETHANAKIDPLAGVWTGTWRDPRSINPEGAQPENALTGTIFTTNCCTYDIKVPAEDGGLRFWRNTSVATQAPGAVATLSANTLGYEWDEDLDNGARPAGLMQLSSTTVNVPQRITDYGSNYGAGTSTHSLTLYRAASGALVFGAGTVQWVWGLDSFHDGAASPIDPSIRQATVNLFADMGVQPTTLQAGLTAATASTDTTPPTTTIASPAPGATLPAGSATTVSGTATDAGGGKVGGIEVSVDGGTTWHRATGRSTWTYTWTPATLGAITVKARAVDDSGNLQPVPASVGATVGGQTCPCTIFGQAVPGNPSENDGLSVELGVKVRTDTAGFLTAVRFYKGATNTGTHTASVWSIGGGLLATTTFTGETATGWQQAPLSSAVAVVPGTTYVVSYHAPNGFYAAQNGAFTGAGTATSPLRALADGEDGPNGVYQYGASAFPTSTFQGSNYFVDAVFETSSGPDTTPPTIASVIPAPSATSVPVSAVVSAVASEPLAAASVSAATALIRDAGSTLVPAAVTYDAATRTISMAPTSPLSASTTYSATIVGGASGITDVAGNPLAVDQVWSFTTAAAVIPPDSGPGGPVLVISGAANPFSSYTAEILRAEGFNAFTVRDLASVTAANLAGFAVVVLGDVPLSDAQATMLTNWVTGGGHLIALRPSSKLSLLLGVTPTGGTVANTYLAVDTSHAPGAGITGQSLQFHGTADLYDLAGATAVASLWSTATNATTHPAVSTRAVGAGTAAAFTYDLARSVVLTRQGNPAWAGQERDGVTPIRSDDLFFGAAAGDPQPDWVDLAKVAIPQADEQQRLLANLINDATKDTVPIPRFWYLPNGAKAAVVLTGDDHGSGGTSARFDQLAAASAPGCSVAAWTCLRGTSYVYPNTPLTNAQVAAYQAAGFEVALHPNTGCADWTPATLDGFFVTQLGQLSSAFPSVAAPTTSRTHCIAWSDWASEPKVELAHGIRLDTNYYYWPPGWVADRPGMFTGSGFPQRFADLDGTMIDVYQAATQMTDESGQSYPSTVNALLDGALGPNGYYGVFLANMHTDSSSSAGADAIVASAVARGVPVISAKQLLAWLDGRNGSTTSAITMSGSVLSFTVTAGAAGLRTMVPASTRAAGGLPCGASCPAKQIASVSRGGTPVPFTRQTVKGVDYAVFDAPTGAYSVTYVADVTAPVVTGVTVSNVTPTTATISWTTDEPSDSVVDYGTSSAALTNTTADGSLTTSHQVVLTALTTTTNYSFHVRSTDSAGNATTEPPSSVLSFATPTAVLTDTTVADFSAGASAGAAVTDVAGGEVRAAPSVGADFSGTTLPSGWTSTPWAGSASATVAGGTVSVDGTLVTAGTTTYGPGRRLTAKATFALEPFQHVGFGTDLNGPPWAMFSTGTTGTGVYARTNSGSTSQDTLLSDEAPLTGVAHTFTIDWQPTRVDYYVDGTLKVSHTIAVTTPMRPVISDFASSTTPVVVDWLRMTPYADVATFTSRVLDAGVPADWGAISWDADAPAGTTLAMAVRTGDTAVPDGSWTAFAPVTPGADIAGSSRYVQYQATLTTTDPDATASLNDVSIGYTSGADNAPPLLVARTPAPAATGASRTGSVTVTFDEDLDPATITSSTFTLRGAGAPADVAATVSYDAASRTATLQPTAPLGAVVTYVATVAASVSDLHGNALGVAATWSFTTAPGTATDTTVADFSAGAPDAGTAVTATGDGEVSLAPAVDAEFNGAALPAGWASTSWTGGGATVSGGAVTVDGGFTAPATPIASGASLETVATFGAAPYAHIGFVSSTDFSGDWALFSTKDTTDTLFARTNVGGSAVDVPIPGAWIGSSHRYRIDWTGAQVVFSIDGTVVSTQSVAIAGPMYPTISDYTLGGAAIVVDWLRISPFASAGVFTSRVFDAGTTVQWMTLDWSAAIPAATALVASVRTGPTPTPDASWTPFSVAATSGAPIAMANRYLQYQIALSSSDPFASPVVADVTASWSSTVPCAATCYVDAVSGSDASAGDSAAQPLRTIAAALGRVASGGTVRVAAGTYAENLVISRPVVLVGAGAGLTAVVPATSAPVCSGPATCGSTVLTIAASAPGTSVSGLTVAGDNPALTSGVLVGGVDVDAHAGIVSAAAGAHFDSIVISDAHLIGMDLSGAAVVVTGSEVRSIAGAVGAVGVSVSAGDASVSTSLVTGSTTAISVATGAAVVAHDDALVGATTALAVQGTGTANATSTWWGNASGPTTTANPGGSGGPVSGVSAPAFAPWRCSGVDTSVAVGFQPDTARQCGLAQRVAFIAQPSVTQAGIAFGTQPVLEVQDLAGNLAINAGGPAYLAVGTFPTNGKLLGTPGGTAVVNGTATVAVVAGAASPTGLTVNKTGVYRLVGIVGTLSVTTAPFSNVAGPPVKLTVTPAIVTMVPGVAKTFKATGTDKYSNPTGDVSLTTSFSLAPDGTCVDNVCTVSTAGPHMLTATNATAVVTKAVTVSAALAVSDESIIRGSTGTRTATFTVSLTAPSSQLVEVDWATADGTAIAPTDYTAAGGHLVFAPGTTLQLITVPITAAVAAGTSRTFTVKLTNPLSSTIVRGSGIGTIRGFGVPTGIRASVGNDKVKVGGTATGVALFNVTLSAASTAPVTVAFTAVNGTAVAGVDFVASSGTITFAPGQTSATIEVVVPGRVAAVGSRTFTVSLSAVVGTSVISPAVGTATLLP